MARAAQLLFSETSRVGKNATEGFWSTWVTWIYIVRCVVHQAGQLTMAKICNVGHYLCTNFSIKFFLYHWLSRPLYTSVIGFGCGRGSLCQQSAKPVGFIVWLWQRVTVSADNKSCWLYCLAVAEGHCVSRQQNLLALLSGCGRGSLCQQTTNPVGFIVWLWQRVTVSADSKTCWLYCLAVAEGHCVSRQQILLALLSGCGRGSLCQQTAKPVGFIVWLWQRVTVSADSKTCWLYCLAVAEGHCVTVSRQQNLLALLSGCGRGSLCYCVTVSADSKTCWLYCLAVAEGHCVTVSRQQNLLALLSGCGRGSLCYCVTVSADSKTCWLYCLAVAEGHCAVRQQNQLALLSGCGRGSLCQQTANPVGFILLHTC